MTMTTTTRTVRRSVAALALLVTGVLLASATAPAASARSQATQETLDLGVRRDGSLTYLLAKSTPATGYVAPRQQSSERVSTVKSNIVVTYTGFSSQAKASFQRAVDLWSLLVKSSQPIRIQATYKALPSGVLGGAGPADFIRDFTGAPRTGTWYPIALANARANADLSPEPDIIAQFQSSGAPWYFGIDGNTPNGKYDFTSVVLRELGHGLGIPDSTDLSGGEGSWGAGSGYPFGYDRLVQNSAGTPLTSITNNSATLAATLQSTTLRWGGAQATSAAGGSKPWIYSPNPFEFGSSIAHLDEDVYATGTANALMTPYLDDGEALHDPGDIVLGMMRDLGWTTTGAKGVAGAPGLKTAIGGPAKVIVGWTPPADTGRQFLTGFRIYRFDNGGSGASASYDVGSTLSSTTITGLTNGTPYRFSVAALNGSGASAQSAKSATIVPVDMKPFGRSDSLIRQQFLDFRGREPSGAESLKWIADLHSGANTPVETVTGIGRLAGSYDISTRMTRLYSAYFERLPDYSGYGYWTGKLRAGSSLKKVSDTFAASSEFTTKYGSLSNTAFVQLVYQNVLKRSPDSAGLAYWVGKLNKKTASRGQVMLNFSESNENVNKMDSEVGSVLLRSSMLRRMPTAVEYAADVALLDGAATLETLAQDIMASPAYDARIP